ncbi:response regulator [Aromatoleum toluvorans]|uniref:Response regulator n=1 Tax=Aromatoleum toluvorans TaxID=92002 RepID=A0ABX1Q749_9RHOO|nr:response regulator [Aromatoleum toluvorans]NMG46206.1 response regulator [Aromatoleum toluvorans]
MNSVSPRAVLVVDRNPRNLALLLQCLSGNGFQTLCAADLAQFDAVLAQSGGIALALVDVDGFDIAVWDRCRRLRERQIEVLVLVGRRAIPSVQLHGARCGARAVLPKPLSPKLLAQMVRGLLEEPA